MRWDIVGSQGAFLETPRPTPVFKRYSDEEFVELLVRKLSSALLSQSWRQSRYGKAITDEYPPRQTPPEVREKHEKSIHRLHVLADMTSPEDDDEADDAQGCLDKVGDFFIWLCPEWALDPPDMFWLVLSMSFFDG